MDTVNIFYLTRYHDRIFLFSWNYRIKTIDLFSYLIRHIWICPQVLLAPAWGASVRCLSCSVISTTFAVLLNPLTTVTGWAHLSRWPTWWTQCLVKTSDHTSVDVPSVRQTPRWVNHYKLFCISLAKYLLMFSWNCNIKSSMMYQTRGCSNMISPFFVIHALLTFPHTFTTPMLLSRNLTHLWSLLANYNCVKI